jgi:hypothetical protein
VHGPNVYLLSLHVELDTLNGPRRLDPQQMPIKLSVSHLRRLRPRRAAANASNEGAWRGGRC